MGSRLTNLVVEVNNNQIGIVANTLRYTRGAGGRTVEGVSEGNGKISQIFGQDVAEAKGRVMFDVHTTVENDSLVDEWLRLLNGNVVTLSGRDKEGNDVQISFTQMTIINDPEFGVAADGVISLEWEGNAPT